MAEQMKAIRVSNYVKNLSSQVAKKVIVDTKGEVTSINGALLFIFEQYLEKSE